MHAITILVLISSVPARQELVLLVLAIPAALNVLKRTVSSTVLNVMQENNSSTVYA